MTVRLTTEALPPLYAVRAVTWGDGTPPSSACASASSPG